MKHIPLYLTFFLLPSACFAQSTSNWEEIAKQDAMEAARKAAKEMGLKPPTKIEMAGEILSPGTSGLILQARPTSKLRSLCGLSVAYSDIAKPQTGGYICSLVRDTRPKTRSYLFRNKSSYDPGYVADPFWMSGHKVMVMRFGRFAGMDGSFLYAFDTQTRLITRLCSSQISDAQFALSPDCKHLAFFATSPNAASNTGTLWVWDTVKQKKTQLRSGISLTGALSWRNDSILVVPTAKKVGSLPQFSCDSLNIATKATSSLRDCAFACYSPDGKRVLRCHRTQHGASNNEKKVRYFLQNLQTGKTTEVPVTSLGTYSPERQIVWSNNSRFLLSVLNSRSYSRRSVLVYDTFAPAKSFPLPVNASSDVYLLPNTPFKAQIGILYRTTRGEKLNELDENKTDCSLSTLDLEPRLLRKRWSHTNVLGIGPYCVEWSE